MQLIQLKNKEFMSKIRIISNHTKYQKGQDINLPEKETTTLLTNGKAIRIRASEETQKESKKEQHKKSKNV